MDKDSVRTSPSARIQRRKPVQKRAVVTVDAILQAAMELIEKEGYAGLTTNRIADYTGVSIGTLYHYFPNKEAIVNALYEDTITKVAQKVRTVIFNHINDRIDNALPGLIDTVMSIFEANQVVLVNLLEQVPELRRSAHSISLEILVYSAARVYISQHHASTAPEDTEACIYFTCTTFFEHVRKYVLEKPEQIPRHMFVEHLAEMITFYLQHHARAPQ